MFKRTSKTSSFLKTFLYIFFSSLIALLIFNLVFPKFSWFRKPIVINPVVRNSDAEGSRISGLFLDAGVPISSINFGQDYFDIELKDGGRIYISSKKDIRVQISSLTAILKQLTINGKSFKVIDFRFGKPIIVTYD